MAGYVRGAGSRGGSTSAVGMMEGAFFVPRTELLEWVNRLLKLNLSKIEQCANGAVYCQIIDSCRPGSVAMRKVNWMAKTDVEFIPNYKLLQAAFDKNCIQRHIEVDKLIRAKYQDNLEFLQWMKCHWEREGASSVEGYDPSQAREGKPLPPWAKEGEHDSVGQAVRARGSSDGAIRAAKAPAAGRGAPKAMVVSKNAFYPNDSAVSGSLATESHRAPALADVDALRQQVQEHLDVISDLRENVDSLENERDFYYGKLREVEIFCVKLQRTVPNVEEDPEQRLISKILEILYAEGDEPRGNDDAVRA